MHIYDAKFQEHCFNISRDIVYSVFPTVWLQTVRRHHWSNLHNRKMSISPKWKKIFQKEKSHSSIFWKAFQISTKYFSFHRHFKKWFISKELPCFCRLFGVQLSSSSGNAELFRRAAKRFSNFFFFNWFYVCFLPLFASAFLNVIRYSKRMRILWYSVSAQWAKMQL